MQWTHRKIIECKHHRKINHVKKSRKKSNLTEQLNRGIETISYKIPQDGQTEKQEVRVASNKK